MTGKMIAETVQMNQTLVVRLLVVQDSFSVTILIAFFPCIFATAMMIAEINLMRKIALNILAMGNNSNASKKMRMGPLFLDFVYLRTEGMYVHTLQYLIFLSVNFESGKYLST